MLLMCLFFKLMAEEDWSETKHRLFLASSWHVEGKVHFRFAQPHGEWRCFEDLIFHLTTLNGWSIVSTAGSVAPAAESRLVQAPTG